MKIHKLVLVALLLCLFGLMVWGVQGCGGEYETVKVEITFTNGEKEILNTRVWTGYHCRVSDLKAGCTTCILDNRCGVRSVKILK